MLRYVAALVFVLICVSACASGDSQTTTLDQVTLASDNSVDPQLLSQLQSVLDSQLTAQGGKGVADVADVRFPCGCTVQGDDALVGWYYNNTGDYDQNSEVNASDLVPIAVNFNLTSSDLQWPFARAADGDGNGEVNFADVTPVGVNFGSTVTNYVIEANTDGAGTWEPVANAPFSEGVAPVGSAVKHWSHTVPFGSRCAEYRAYAGEEVPTVDLFDLSTLPVSDPVVAPENWTELVLTPANENYAAHHAVALVDGKPAILYTRDDRDEIYYSYALVEKPALPADWETVVVDDSDNLGGTLSLCEVLGAVCVSYEDTTAQDVFVGIATTTTPSGGEDFNIHEPDPLAIGQMHLLNVEGKLRGFYRRGGSIVYMVDNVPPWPSAPSDWHYILVDDGEQYDYLQCASVGNRPSLAYQRKDGGFNELVFVQAGNSDPDNEADWSSVVIDDVYKNSGNWVRLSINDMGYPVIAYTNVDIVHFLKYAYAGSTDATSDTDWTTLTVFQQDQTHLGNWLGLGMYGNRPLLSYIETGSGSTDGLHVAYSTTDNPAGPDDFARGVLDPGGTYFVNQDTSVLMLNDGTPAVFYRTSEGLKYLYYTP